MPKDKDTKKGPGTKKRKQARYNTPPSFQYLPVGRIRGNKWNPRTTGFDGPRFDELVASIRQKGVIQPIVVRPIREADYDYEILAGERRHRAMSLIISEDPTRCAIPAIIRECDDEEAFEICFIENLQRQDLSEPEEARAFAEYVDRKGAEAVVTLAERLGVSPRYVRKRVEVMRLPKPVIWAWRKELLQYGHLEQFLRIADKKDRLITLKQIIAAWNDGEGIPTVKDFKQAIDEASADLVRALFDKRECSTCAKNSETQRHLFGIGDENARCLDSRCYLAKQKEWLSENWQAHLKTLDPELVTNRIRFSDELSHSEWEPFYHRAVPERCMTCESFVTILSPTGSMLHQRACCGGRECRQETLYGRRANPGAAQSAESAEAPDAVDPGGEGMESESEPPGKAWHGEFFREEFFKVRIPEKAKELDPFDEKMIRLSLFATVASNNHIHPWFSERMDLDKKPKESLYGFFLTCWEIFSAIQGFPADQLPGLVHEATIQILMSTNTVPPNTRRRAATFLGIDLAAEWRITREYLEKKTKSEIVSIINRFNVLDQERAWKFATESFALKAKSAVGRLKKDQMAGIILDSGIDLAGIVPAEILHDSTARHVGIPPAEADAQTQSAADPPEAQAAAEPRPSCLTDSKEPHPLSNCSDEIPYDSSEVDLSCTFDREEGEVQDAVR